MRVAALLLMLVALGGWAPGVWSAAGGDATDARSAGSVPPLPASEAPPEAVVGVFEEVLLRNMQAGEAMAYQQRYQVLEPVVRRVFDSRRMAFFLFGRTWSSLQETERQRFIDWFERLTTATYASRFDSFGGQSFERVDVRQTSDSRARVSTQLERPDKDAVNFVYLMGRDGDSGWQVINVVANGVSDLAIRRSQYGRLYERGGLDAVIDDIQAEIADLEDE